MNEHRKIMRRVGTILIVVGLIDIGFMVYCIWVGMTYASSLNIFAVIGGIFLWRGSMRAARLVARYSAFILAGALGGCLVLMPLMRPAGLWMAEFQVNPVTTSLTVVMMPALLGLFAWVYRRLRAPAVISALVAAGEDASPPRRYFVIGAAIPVILAVVLHVTLGGAMGAKAIALAKAKYGDAYRYNPSSFSQSGDQTQVELDAYNDHEIRSVTVDW